MKTSTLLTSLRNLRVPALVLAGSLPGAASGAESQLSLTPGTSANIVRLTVNDPGNRVWVLQGSADFNTWTPLESLKVHNGAFTRGHTNSPGATHQFFRAVCDADWPDIPSTTGTALVWPASPYNYAAPVLPPGFSVPPIVGQDNTPRDNPTTDAGSALGRILFYDKRLSANQTVSCASCHQQAHGFSDPRRFSVGFEGGLTDRNSMGLSHARWYQRGAFFWDERAATLEAQVLQPIQNPVEMGMTLGGLTNRLSAEPFYTNLFTTTFGTPGVTANRIARALAQFVRSIVSVNFRYDQGVATGFSNFTAQENLGRQIFLGQVGTATCAACHGTDNFVPGPVINNNGLEFPIVDRGLGAITGNPADDGKFKAPSLRNIELTAPYMHDGRFATLEEVVEFYNSGVVNNPNLSPPLRNPPGTPNAGQPRRLNLSVPQKAALVAFLKTLTDPGLATDPKYSDPFNYGD